MGCTDTRASSKNQKKASQIPRESQRVPNAPNNIAGVPPNTGPSLEEQQIMSEIQSARKANFSAVDTRRRQILPAQSPNPKIQYHATCIRMIIYAYLIANSCRAPQVTAQLVFQDLWQSFMPMNNIYNLLSMRQCGLTLMNFPSQFEKNQQLKELSEALVYLKLREHRCPKSRALVFAKKKQRNIDGTATKDGPAGFKVLRPRKPPDYLSNGWLKLQKHHYDGLQGVSEQVRRSVTKQKRSITSYNQVDRQQMEQLRKTRQAQNKGFLKVGSNAILIKQIGGLKQQLLKDKQSHKRHMSQGNRFLSNQMNREDYGEPVGMTTDSLIIKLAAFEGPMTHSRQFSTGQQDTTKRQKLKDSQLKIEAMQTFDSCRNPESQSTLKPSDKFGMTLKRSTMNADRPTFYGRVLTKSKRQLAEKDMHRFYDTINHLFMNRNPTATNV